MIQIVETVVFYHFKHRNVGIGMFSMPYVYTVIIYCAEMTPKVHLNLRL